MNTKIKLLNPVSNSTRIRNYIEDYVASLFPFDLQIGWVMGKINYRYPDKPDDNSIGFIAFDVPGRDRAKLKTTRYLTRKCKLNEIASLNDEQIRDLSEKINGLLWTVEELNDVELIHGSDITQAYDEKIGGNSCMTGSNSSYTRLYEINPTRFEMLIMRSNNDSARAIIHKLDDGRKLLGVVYATAEHLHDKMQNYAIKQNWILRKNADSSEKNTWIMSDLQYNNGEIPYMDVLTNGEICGNLLTVSYNSGNFELCNQNGNLEGGYHCENCGDHIHEDDIYGDGGGNFYCEHCFNENFIYCPKCDDVEHNNDAVFIQDKEIYVCLYCVDKHYYKCVNCNDYHALDNTQILDDEPYCENCFNKIADYCENCNEVFCTEDLTSVNDSGPLCEDCATAVQESERVIL